MNTPKELILDFISAYKQWNDEAHETAENDEIEGIDKADEKYSTLISKFCSSDVIPQGIAFGSDSSHSLEEEVIITITQNNDDATVITKHTDEDGFICDYEYQAVKTSGGWKIRSLLYVDGSSKYECL